MTHESLFSFQFRRLRQRLCDALRAGGQPYPDAAALFITTNAPGEAHNYLHAELMKDAEYRRAYQDAGCYLDCLDYPACTCGRRDCDTR